MSQTNKPSLSQNSKIPIEIQNLNPQNLSRKSENMYSKCFHYALIYEYVLIEGLSLLTASLLGFLPSLRNLPRPNTDTPINFYHKIVHKLCTSNNPLFAFKVKKYFLKSTTGWITCKECKVLWTSCVLVSGENTAEKKSGLLQSDRKFTVCYCIAQFEKIFFQGKITNGSFQQPFRSWLVKYRTSTKEGNS